VSLFFLRVALALPSTTLFSHLVSTPSTFIPLLFSFITAVTTIVLYSSFSLIIALRPKAIP
jgi:hypothetical protein